MVKEAVWQAIKKEANVNLNKNLIIIKHNNIIQIKTSPLIRGEVFMFKKKILESLKTTLPVGYKINFK